MASKQVTKRLLHELRSYEKEPSDALLQLGPVSDDQLTQWTAILKGPSGTAYSGVFLLSFPSTLLESFSFVFLLLILPQN